MKSDLARNMPAALNGSDLGSVLSGKWHSLLSHIRERISFVTEKVTAIAAAFSDFLPNPVPVADQAVSKLSATAVSNAQELSIASDEKMAAKKFAVAFVLQHGLDRKPREPDKAFNAILLFVLAIFEGVLTATFFLGGGFVPGIAEALGLGLSISGINIVVAGLIGGGVFGRYWNYGVNAPEPSRTMIRKRWAGRAGSVLTALALAGLLIASGILRATGEPEHLGFTLENFGAAATNFHSLMLWALGLSFSILAWIKGLGAFSDPYPGYTEASKAVTTAEQRIHEAHQYGSGEIEDICDEALDELADMHDEVLGQREELAESLNEVRRDREAVRVAIANAPSDFAAYKDAQQTTLYMLNSGAADALQAEPDLTAALALLEDELPEVPHDLASHAAGFEDQRSKAETRIAKAKVEAMQTLNEAYRRALSHKS